MPRYRLSLEYQGKRYRGWQAQKNARTVQGELLAAAVSSFGGSVDIQGAGRTDAGVHALGQVAHMDLQVAVPPDEIPAALNECLPEDINVMHASRAASGFHARRLVTGRSYLYQVSRRRTAFGKNLVWWVRDRLDCSSMRRAADLLPGRHDFVSFADARLDESHSTLVVVEQAVLKEAGDLILLRLRASHFLWKMARRITGVLVEVGRGRLTVEGFRRLLREPSDFPAAFTAPPSGLFLEEVVYAGERYQRPLKPVMEVASR